MRIRVAYRWPWRCYGYVRCPDGNIAIDFGKTTYWLTRKYRGHHRR